MSDPLLHDEPWPHHRCAPQKELDVDLLTDALRRMIKAHEDLSVDTEGRYPPLDAGCNDCTLGSTPLSHDTGLCPYHYAVHALRMIEAVDRH
jgi:hypothetical protein